MKEIQVEGKTVPIAVDKALKELALRRDQVEVVVLNEGSGGFLGIGSRKACVVIRERKWTGERKERRPAQKFHRDARPRNHKGGAHVPQQGTPQQGTPQQGTPHRAQSPIVVQEKRPAIGQTPAEIPPIVESAKSVVSQILNLFGARFTELKAEWDSRQSRVCVEFSSEPGSIFAGKDDRMLEAMQFLVTLIVSRKNKTPVAVQVDTQDHWKRMEGEILEKVTRAVETVKNTGHPYRLDPMSPAIRRFVHKTLEARTDVEMVSEGESKWRKIIIKPRT